MSSDSLAQYTFFDLHSNIRFLIKAYDICDSMINVDSRAHFYLRRLCPMLFYLYFDRVCVYAACVLTEKSPRGKKASSNKRLDVKINTHSRGIAVRSMDVYYLPT